jgi:CO/xanthine dehydrogenase Mo-binding subunit
VDAHRKITGRERFAADVVVDGMVHAALSRSWHAHARIRAVRADGVRSIPGVLGVFTAGDLRAGLYGRIVRDVSVLASNKVRYIGEPVAAVVAVDRNTAEVAASLVEVEYEPIAAVYEPRAALREDAPAVHDAPWQYDGSVVRPGDPRNLQSCTAHGTLETVEDEIAAARWVVDQTYETVTGHQGYLEPQSTVARWLEDQRLELWVPNKTPYRLREQLSACLDIPVENILVHPVAIGGDFGGKGSPMGAPLCAELSRLVDRPVRLALRYHEDLEATSPRHSSSIRVRLGCDGQGRFVGLHVDALLDGGAYAGFKPLPDVVLRGVNRAGSAYRVGKAYVTARIAYTNTVPRGHARSPGSPQVSFAVESAIDELAEASGITPWELRLRNVLRDGEIGHEGVEYRQHRGADVLELARKHVARRDPPPGWRHGWGVALYDRPTELGYTSIRLEERPGGCLSVSVPVPDTGTGSHTVVRDVLSRALHLDPSRIRVEHVPTSDLPGDQGVGGSRVTATLSAAAQDAASRWMGRGDKTSVVVERSVKESPVISYCAQVAQVAVDVESGFVRLLELLTVVDVADVVCPASHQSQVDGGAAMGIGFALQEDLLMHAGQVGASSLGDFRIPSMRDIPPLLTVLLRDGVGIGPANVKAIGELTNPAVGPAVANAIFDAVGVRVRKLPIAAQAVWEALHDRPGARSEERS